MAAAQRSPSGILGTGKYIGVAMTGNKNITALNYNSIMIICSLSYHGQIHVQDTMGPSWRKLLCYFWIVNRFCAVYPIYHGCLCLCSLIARFMGLTWGQHGAHLGPVGPRWAPCWPHEPCYQGCHFIRNRNIGYARSVPPCLSKITMLIIKIWNYRKKKI